MQRLRVVLLGALIGLAACGGSSAAPYRGRLVDDKQQPIVGGVVLATNYDDEVLGQTTTGADGSFSLQVDEVNVYSFELHRSAEPASGWIVLTALHERAHDLGVQSLLPAPTVTTGADGFTVAGVAAPGMVALDGHLWPVSAGPIPPELAVDGAVHFVRVVAKDYDVVSYSDGASVVVPAQPPPAVLHGTRLRPRGDGTYFGESELASDPVLLAAPGPLRAIVVTKPSRPLTGIELESFSERWTIPSSDCRGSDEAMVCRGDWPIVERFHLAPHVFFDLLIAR